MIKHLASGVECEQLVVVVHLADKQLRAIKKLRREFTNVFDQGCLLIPRGKSGHDQEVILSGGGSETIVTGSVSNHQLSTDRGDGSLSEFAISFRGPGPKAGNREFGLPGEFLREQQHAGSGIVERLSAGIQISQMASQSLLRCRGHNCRLLSGLGWNLNRSTSPVDSVGLRGRQVGLRISAQSPDRVAQADSSQKTAEHTERVDQPADASHNGNWFTINMDRFRRCSCRREFLQSGSHVHTGTGGLCWWGWSLDSQTEHNRSWCRLRGEFDRRSGGRTAGWDSDCRSLFGGGFHHADSPFQRSESVQGVP